MNARIALSSKLAIIVSVVGTFQKSDVLLKRSSRNIRSREVDLPVLEWNSSRSVDPGQINIPAVYGSINPMPAILRRVIKNATILAGQRHLVKEY